MPTPTPSADCINSLGTGSSSSPERGTSNIVAVILCSFPCSSAGKESACNAGDLRSIPGLGRSPRQGKGYPIQYSGLENSIDCIVHGVTKSRTQLSNFHVSRFLKTTALQIASALSSANIGSTCGQAPTGTWNETLINGSLWLAEFLL